MTTDTKIAESKAKPDERHPFEITVERDRVGVTIITMFSKPLEALFKAWSNGETERYADRRDFNDDQLRLLGLDRNASIYKFKDPPLPTKRWYDLTRGLLVSNDFNMRFLTLVGIGKDNGVSLKIQTPMSRTSIQAIMRGAQSAAEEILRELAKPISVSAIVTLQETTQVKKGL